MVAEEVYMKYVFVARISTRENVTMFQRGRLKCKDKLQIIIIFNNVSRVQKYSLNLCMQISFIIQTVFTVNTNC